MREIIQTIVNEADERCYGSWRGQEYPVLFHIKGEDVVIESNTGRFVSILKGAQVMRGLRTQESEKFNRFWELIQLEAERTDHIFFGYAGEGRDFETDDLEGEDFSGWLIPIDRATEFEKDWKIHGDGAEMAAWSDFFLFALWKKNGSNINILFKRYD